MQTQEGASFRDGLLFEITFANSKGGLLFEMGFFSRLCPLDFFSRFYGMIYVTRKGRVKESFCSICPAGEKSKPFCITILYAIPVYVNPKTEWSFIFMKKTENNFFMKKCPLGCNNLFFLYYNFYLDTTVRIQYM